ncbi:protein-glutamine gamma-glutamyltransferase 2-like protein [Dinothrombium tinctorium]|uniref:Protein-glutamine gamma-glutamyltransferase 2-like protein n=1 Tax=Dinothrombium tinctorium TaxID=1965070 RepID=A0A3S3NXH9_9ACAR|nr:protein-glutamine gamma-glutamyltransferase 2-like protein [Dinothrombium tinctorium]RWS02277.1 protein-glutamine gamma-glutamyltransferase 2-like protein [Dinothrombium tinctorium]
MISINLNTLNNSIDHKTSSFYEGLEEPLDYLIVRRGQYFNISLTCIEKLDLARIILYLDQEFKEKAKYEWNYIIDHDMQNETLIHISIKTNAIKTPIGEWLLRVGYKSLNDTIHWHNDECKIIIIFNPWMEDDPVHIDKLNETALNSYVLDEEGQIFGTTMINNTILLLLV